MDGMTKAVKERYDKLMGDIEAKGKEIEAIQEELVPLKAYLKAAGVLNDRTGKRGRKSASVLPKEDKKEGGEGRPEPSAKGTKK